METVAIFAERISCYRLVSHTTLLLFCSDKKSARVISKQEVKLQDMSLERAFYFTSQEARTRQQTDVLLTK